LSKQIFLYILFGVLTTAVSAAVYFAASWGANFSAWLASVVSWFFAVAFAFVTNKFFVFASKTTGSKALRETLLFFLLRTVSLVINVGIMLVFVDIMDLHEPAFFALAQITVLVFNYAASKFLVFK